jgi:hypothetical protein
LPQDAIRGGARMLLEEPHSSHIQTSKPAEWPTSGGLLLCDLAVFHFIEDDAALMQRNSPRSRVLRGNAMFTHAKPLKFDDCFSEGAAAYKIRPS